MQFVIYWSIGAGEKGFGSDGPSVWLVTGGSKELIAKVANQDVVGLEAGEHLALLMTRSMAPGSKWAVRYNGKLSCEK